MLGGAQDNTMIYYNPGALGLLENSSISINANAYRIENIRVENALGEQADFKSAKVGSVPLLAGGMINREGSDWKIGYAFLNPVSFDFKGIARVEGNFDLIEETESSGSKIVKISGISSKSVSPTISVIIRGANQLVLDETERSLHDALCVIRCLVKEKALIAGGGAPEIEVARVLMKESQKLSGVEQFVYQEFAQALEVIPITLAENAGLNPINVVTDLKNRHENNEVNAGISVRRSGASNTYDEHILQPVLVTQSSITLASECVKSILRIDDITLSR